MCKWTVDADDLELDSKVLDLLVQNSPVRSFFSTNRPKLGVAGMKGQGKTYLLKIKRRESQEQSILCIPRDGMVDSLNPLPQGRIATSVTAYVSTYEPWTDMWKLSIGISVLPTYRACQRRPRAIRRRAVR